MSQVIVVRGDVGVLRGERGEEGYDLGKGYVVKEMEKEC